IASDVSCSITFCCGESSTVTEASHAERTQPSPSAALIVDQKSKSGERCWPSDTAVFLLSESEALK
ncbi:hypothetical protein, partial [Salmonella sp. gx-f7]|uniref:hypothetical protein n=1 Tax=Salmonella sp. gx-f7 TaxID=2582606 RepID=UPI001F23DD1C